MQQQIKHADGELPYCSCGRSPRHFKDLRGVHRGGGHFLECCPCDRRTPRCATFELAHVEFCRMTGQPSAQARPRSLRTVRA